MAVTLDAKVDGGKTSGATSLAWNHTVGTLTNGLITVQLDSGAGAVPTTTSVQWDALGTPASLTKQTNRSADAHCATEHWGLKAPAAGTKQVKITMPSSVEITAGSASWQYVDQSTTAGFRNSGDTASGSGGTSPSGTANTVNGDVVLFSAFVDETSSNFTLTPTVGTLIHQQEVGAATHSGASAYIAATGTTQAVGFSGITGGDVWGLLASSIKWDGTGPSGGSTVVERRTFGSVGRVGTRRAA